MGFVKWHKNITEKVRIQLGLTQYQLMWIAWPKRFSYGSFNTLLLYALMHNFK